MCKFKVEYLLLLFIAGSFNPFSFSNMASDGFHVSGSLMCVLTRISDERVPSILSELNPIKIKKIKDARNMGGLCKYGHKY